MYCGRIKEYFFHKKRRRRRKKRGELVVDETKLLAK
jgi:hypothetical protein